MVGGQRNVAVAIVCWWSHSQPGFWLLTVASGAEWLFRGLRSGGRGLGVPLRPNPVRPTPWAYDGVLGEGSIPAPLPPPAWLKGLHSLPALVGNLAQWQQEFLI